MACTHKCRNFVHIYPLFFFFFFLEDASVHTKFKTLHSRHPYWNSGVVGNKTGAMDRKDTLLLLHCVYILFCMLNKIWNFHQYENSIETHWALNTIGVKGHLVSSCQCAVFWHEMLFCPPQRLGCDNMLDSSQQEDPCLQCGGSGQSCYPVKSTFTTNNLPHGSGGVKPSSVL